MFEGQRSEGHALAFALTHVDADFAAMLQLDVSVPSHPFCLQASIRYQYTHTLHAEALSVSPYDLGTIEAPRFMIKGTHTHTHAPVIKATQHTLL